MPRHFEVETIPGVGAFNANSEVMLFVRNMVETPDRYRCEQAKIDLFKGRRLVQSALYGHLVSEAAARRANILVTELDDAGAVKRSIRIKKVA